MSSRPSSDEESGVTRATDSLLLKLLALDGWKIEVTTHDLGVKVLGRRGAEEIVRFGRSASEVSFEFFKAAHGEAPP